MPEEGSETSPAVRPVSAPLRLDTPLTNSEELLDVLDDELRSQDSCLGLAHTVPVLSVPEWTCQEVTARHTWVQAPVSEVAGQLRDLGHRAGLGQHSGVHTKHHAHAGRHHPGPRP